MSTPLFENVTRRAVPSARLARAAMSGLLAASCAGCKDDKASAKSGVQGDGSDSQLSQEELKAACADMVDEAKKNVDLGTACADMVEGAVKAQDLDKVCSDKVASAEKKTTKDSDKTWGDQVDALKLQCAPILATVEEKTINSEQKEYTFAQLTKMCDDRGGYTQIGAGCGGHNTCKGFSYGDWGPGAATLTEHSCSGVNGCLGVFCVDTAKDQKRKPEKLYDMDYTDPGPHGCTHCHAPSEADGKTQDKTKFTVYVYDADNSPYSGPARTLDNWKDTRTAAEQERIVAFGIHGVLPDGTAVNQMAPYYQFLSRNEIASLVKYIREKLTPVIAPIKTKDPS